MKKWLFNPFIYVAGTKALLMGWAIMLLTAAVAFFSNAHFDGAIDMHVLSPMPAYIYLAEQLIDWLGVVLAFYAGGVLFSHSSIRFIDVAGTIALARWPMLLAACTAFGTKMPHTDSMQVLMNSITPGFIALAIVNVILGIWMIALMYNAFRVSCNMKGQKATVVFICGLLVAEIATHIILHKIYLHII